MASSGKKKTTMAKLNREAKMRERRMDKAARRDARKQLAADVAAGIVPAPEVEAHDPYAPGGEQHTRPALTARGDRH
ncbi:MAG TPA: hypothetical protein VFZ89_14410 [Solirubrobacteraceae bacterium]